MNAKIVSNHHEQSIWSVGSQSISHIGPSRKVLFDIEITVVNFSCYQNHADQELSFFQPWKRCTRLANVDAEKTKSSWSGVKNLSMTSDWPVSPALNGFEKSKINYCGLLNLKIKHWFDFTMIIIWPVVFTCLHLCFLFEWKQLIICLCYKRHQKWINWSIIIRNLWENHLISWNTTTIDDQEVLSGATS